MSDTPIWLYKERFDLIEQLAKDTYTRLAKQVIQKIKALKNDTTENGLENAWEEYKYQIQREQGPFFEAYEQTILDLCDDLIAELPIELNKLLWIWTREFDQTWPNDQDEATFDEWQSSDVAKELSNRVADVAINEQLLIDPDEERDRERHEEDWNSNFDED
jgi:hypothetical protein